MLKKVLAVTSLSLALAASAHAAVADFESVAVGSYSSFTQNGITFSGNLTVSDDSNGTYVLAAPGTHFLDNRYGGTPFTFTFASSDSFGLQIGATNSAQTLSAYDSSNNLLGSLAIPNQVGTLAYPYTNFYSLSYSGMSKVTLSADAGDWIVVDNVTTAPVPEPETYAMMVLGLGIVSAATRRRKI